MAYNASYGQTPEAYNADGLAAATPSSSNDLVARQLAIREKELELQIAQERRKEREAELAILQLKNQLAGQQDANGGVTDAQPDSSQFDAAGGFLRQRARQSSMSAMSPPDRSQYGATAVPPTGGNFVPDNVTSPTVPPPTMSGNDGGLPQGHPTGQYGSTSLDYGSLGLASLPSYQTDKLLTQLQGQSQSTQHPAFDESALDMQDLSMAFSPDFFNWLPDDINAQQGPFGFAPPTSARDGVDRASDGGMVGRRDGSIDFAQFQRDMDQAAQHQLGSAVNPAALGNPSTSQAQPVFANPTPPLASKTEAMTSPLNAVASTSTAPPRKSASKKETITTYANCQSCSTPIAKLLVRVPLMTAPNEVNLVAHYFCMSCADRALPSKKASAFRGAACSSAAKTDGATVSQRKRYRAADDRVEDAGDVSTACGSTRTICDVCQRLVGVGSTTQRHDHVAHAVASPSNGHGASTLAVEVVCSSCDRKYSRCTDCGGGGGSGRLGIGKWRCKEMFLPGRKTCRLSHSRLGARTVELGVWETPQDIADDHLMDEVLARCKTMWREKTLARLAIPEVLECDTNGDPSHPLRTYADIEAKLDRGWPSREDLIRNRNNDPDKIRRFIGLTWTPTRTRRGSLGGMDAERRDVDGTPRAAADGLQTVLPNVRRTNDVIPPGCELTFQWVGEWDVQAGSLLISTSVPFDGSDGEDRSALSVGEMITKITQIMQSVNQTRTPPLPPLEHLWVVSRNSSLLIRERLADTLIRKRHFVTVDEYLTRFPSFKSSLTNRPGGLHPDLEPEEEEHDATTGQPLPPLILVRWLGNTSAQNSEKLNELKQLEFAGGSKAKKGRGKKAVKNE